MFPIVEPRQRPERFRLNRHSPLAESAVFLGLGGFDAAGSVWYPDARRLLGGVPNDGTLTNMDPATDWVWSPELGRFGCEVITSQYITMGDIAAFDSLTAVTLCTWIKPSSIANGERILSKWAGGAPEFTFLLCTQDTTRPALVVYATNQFFGKKATATDLVVGQWKHLAVTWVPDAIQIYVNGVEVAQSAWYSGTVSRLSATTADFRVGYSATDAVDAIYSDVAAYSRILSPAEISALADPSNTMLSVGGVPLILPPRRVAFPAAVAEPSGFKPYWLRRSTQIIGGGVA